jgi:hypothetical protein
MKRPECGTVTAMGEKEWWRGCGCGIFFLFLHEDVKK